MVVAQSVIVGLATFQVPLGLLTAPRTRRARRVLNSNEICSHRKSRSALEDEGPCAGFRTSGVLKQTPIYCSPYSGDSRSLFLLEREQEVPHCFHQSRSSFSPSVHGSLEKPRGPDVARNETHQCATQRIDASVRIHQV